MTRVTKDPQVRMAEILEATEELFSTKGYHETAISDIVKKIGVAQGTFYYYFKSKEEVLEAVVMQKLTRILSEIRTVTDSKSTNVYSKIEYLVNKPLSSLRTQDGLLFDYLYNDRYLHIIDKFARQGYEILTPLLLDVMEEGNREGTFSILHPEETADFVMAIIDCLIESMYKKYPEEQVSYRLIIAQTLIEKALGMPEGTLKLSF